MTDEEIGRTLRWLCSIPIGCGVRVRIFCDECEMTFGEGHRHYVGWDVRPGGETLVECLQDLLRQRQEIDAHIRDNPPRRGA